MELATAEPNDIALWVVIRLESLSTRSADRFPLGMFYIHQGDLCIVPTRHISVRTTARQREHPIKLSALRFRHLWKELLSASHPLPHKRTLGLVW